MLFYIKGLLDGFLTRFSPTTVCIIAILSFLIVRKVYTVLRFIFSFEGGIIAGTIETIFPYVMKSSFASKKLNEESSKLLKETLKLYTSKEVQEFNLYKLPEKGVEPKELLQRMRSYIKDYGDHSYEKGLCSGSVYSSSNKEHLAAQCEAFAIFCTSNCLHMDQFPALCKFEREIIRFTRDLMHGDSNVKGIVTSGGTESLMLSIKSYRDLTETKKPWIRNPEIIAVDTIHAAVDKGCHLMNVKLLRVPIDRETCTSTPNSAEKYITKNTIAIYISAPCYPYGIIDDVEGYAELAKKYGLYLHIDSCLGGWYLPFAYRLGVGIPKFDFLVDGVTSISSDTHKYGMAPKGTSVVLFKNKELRNAAFYVHMKWKGGFYGTPTFAGSRSGAIIASCWAALMINGMDNYMKTSKEIHETVQTIKKGVQRIKGIETAGDPISMLVNIRAEKNTNDFSVYQVMDEMNKLGWALRGTSGSPQGFQFCVVSRSVGMGEKFVGDLEKSVETVRKNPKLHLKNSASLYGIAAYAPEKFLGEIGLATLAFFNDGKEVEEEEEEEGEEEEVEKKEK